MSQNKVFMKNFLIIFAANLLMIAIFYKSIDHFAEQKYLTLARNFTPTEDSIIQKNYSQMISVIPRPYNYYIASIDYGNFGLDSGVCPNMGLTKMELFENAMIVTFHNLEYIDREISPMDSYEFYFDNKQNLIYSRLNPLQPLHRHMPDISR